MARHPINLAGVFMAATLVLAIQGCAAPAATRAGHSAETPENKQPTARRFEYARLAMGSRVSIVLYASDEPIEPARRAFGVIDRYEQALSDYDPRSEAMRLTHREHGVWRSVSQELLDALLASQHAWTASGGAFDVTIGPVTALWREANASGRQPSGEEIQRASSTVGMQWLEIDEQSQRVRLRRPGMRLDFGGIGKGLAADAALESLREDGIAAALVSIGGDIALGAPPPGQEGWVVRTSPATESRGRRGPMRTLSDCGVATSGDAFRSYELRDGRGSHVLSAETGSPTEAGPVVSVVAASAWRADALATIAKAAGEAKARAAAETLGGACIEVLSGED